MCSPNEESIQPAHTLNLIRICCLHKDNSSPWLSTLRPVNILIRLWMRRLIWIFAGRTCPTVCFLRLWLLYKNLCNRCMYVTQQTFDFTNCWRAPWTICKAFNISISFQFISSVTYHRNRLPIRCKSVYEVNLSIGNSDISSAIWNRNMIESAQKSDTMIFQCLHA